MVSTIRIGPEGGPYVKVEENNGTLDITTPNDTVDLQSNELVNAALGGIMNANGNDITNVNQLDADSVNTDDLGISDTILTSGSYATVMGGSATEDLSDVTSTSYTAVGGLSGVVNTGNIPAGATLYGEFYARGGISDGTETLTARPALINGRDTAFLSEFEVSTQSTGNDTMTSGPIEVTTDLSANDFWQMWRVEAKVTGGTGSFVSYLAALSFYWRVD